MKLKIKTVKLLRQIKAAILKEPRQFIMSSWFQRAEGVPNCGTAACIGGWAITLANKTTPSLARRQCFHQNPGDVLGITDFQASRLFHLIQWPKKFRESFRVETPKNARHNAKVGARRIDHFIKSGGRE